MSVLEKLTPPIKPNEYIEKVIIKAILNEEIQPGSSLPAERTLATRLGVTRPTLREALHRMERDGWISINHGKPTMVNNIWKDGNLNILSGIMQYGDELSTDIVRNLLIVRSDLAPSYAYYASINDPEMIISHLRSWVSLAEDPKKYASFDWNLHYILTLASGNPIYTLIINGFSQIYLELAEKYFRKPVTRKKSMKFYTNLLELFINGDQDKVYLLTKEIMEESIRLFELY